jgi:predicted RNA-binding protein with PUA-like domain
MLIMNYWLMKSEPYDYSFDDLKNEADSTAEWDGVRNYQARNFLRDEIKIGDMILYYHSNSKPSGIVGTATVVKEGYPDYTAWDPDSDHPDERSTPDNPIWYMVDIKAHKTFKRMISLAEIKADEFLSDMVLVRNSRLSVQPVAEEYFEYICSLATG